MMLLIVFFYDISLCNSCFRISRFWFQICLTKYKLELVIRLQLKQATHKKLWCTRLKLMLDYIQTIQQCFFIKNSWSWHMITFLEISIGISKLTHHFNQLLNSFRFLTIHSINFTQSNNICIYLFKMLFH